MKAAIILFILLLKMFFIKKKKSRSSPVREHLKLFGQVFFWNHQSRIHTGARRRSRTAFPPKGGTLLGCGCTSSGCSPVGATPLPRQSPMSLTAAVQLPSQGHLSPLSALHFVKRQSLPIKAEKNPNSIFM